MSGQGSPTHVPEGQPDPVIVGPGMKTMGEDAYTKASTVTPSLNSDKKHQMSSDAPSYFADIPGIKLSPPSPDRSTTSPAHAAKDAHSGMELLRHLSLTGNASPIQPEVDPRQQHPGLRLTRRIISAAFCIPYKLYYRSGSDWVGFDLSHILFYVRRVDKSGT